MGLPQPAGMLPTFTVGGATATDLTNLITLVGRIGASKTTTLRNINGGGSGYTPANGKTFYPLGMKFLVKAAGTSGNIYLYQSTNDVGQEGVTAATGQVYFGSSANASQFILGGVTLGKYFEQWGEIPLVGFNATNGKYYTIEGEANAPTLIVFVYGYER